MNIRYILPQDVAPLSRLMAAAPLWQRYSVTVESAAKRLQSGVDSHASILVAEVENQAAGFVWYVENGAFHRSGYIMLIGVDEKQKGKGVGRELMAKAEEAMFAKMNDVFLLVSDFNTDAQTFYQRLGYTQVGALKDYVVPGITELIFRKTKS